MKIVEQVKQWVGVRYLHQGITRSGCDCSGLLVGVLKELGYLRSFVMPVYPLDWNLHNPKHNYLQEYLDKYCFKTDKPQPEDLVVFRFGRHISHIGILVDGLTFIHCYMTAGVKYGTLNSGQWKERVVGYWRLDFDLLR
jgi:cell wall-associated NlpC family hydrolase